MDKISAIIVAKNKPPYLLKTIDSIVDLADEIIIVDIGIDGLFKEELKRIGKVRLIEMDQEVPYVELIREKTKDFSKNNFVFLLDPDEIVSPQLKELIKTKLRDYDYFKIPRKNIIFGRWIKHSRWWPDYQIRVFKKNKVVWPKIIHRQPKVAGRGFEVEAKEELSLIHHNYKNLDEYLDKAKRYAKYEAQELYDDKKTYTFSDAVSRSLNEFVSRYFAAEGFRDGNQGFVLAILQLIYYFFVYFYYLEMKQFKSSDKIDEAEFFRSGLKEVLHWKKNKTWKDRLIKKIL
ncbi:glycosyltransferase [Patescibacteria group bacterium]|nr:glycosyltransferase [Patescibacteria group bacterium]